MTEAKCRRVSSGWGEQGLNAGEHKGTFLGCRSVLKLDGGDSCTLHTFIKTHQTLPTVSEFYGIKNIPKQSC